MKNSSRNNLYLFLSLLLVIACPLDVEGALRVWAVGDGVRVDPVSGELIEGMQTFFGPVVDSNPKDNNWVWNKATGVISLKAARNEVVACQVIVETDRAARGVNIRAADLTGPGGNRILSSNVALFRQWYHYVPLSKAPRQGVRYPLKAGWYPDALIPLDAALHGGPFDIPGEDFYSTDPQGEPAQMLTAQTNQAVWLDLYVPDQTPPGLYRGTLSITAEGEPDRSLTLSLEVFDFKIPDEFHTTWEFMEYGRITGGPEDVELKTYRLAQQHRVTVSSTGMMPDTIGQGYDLKLDWEKFDRRWGKFFDGSAFVEGPGKGRPVSHLLLPFDARVWREDKKPAWWGQDWPFPLPGDSTGQDFTPEYEKAFIKKLVEFERHFNRRGWENTKMMFWPNGVDEPQPNNGEAGLKPLNMARHYGGLLKRSGVQKIKYRLDIGSGLRSIVDLNGDGRIEPDTREVVDYIQEVVDVWNCSGKWIIPDILNMKPGENRWTDVWFYNGYDPAVGSGLVIGESLGFRTWQWIVWKYRLSGVCDWEFGITQGKNAFRQMIISDSEGYPYLRNTYVYPGGQIGLEGEPLPSIRLKMIRRSLQDYEYFWLLTESSKDRGEAADKVVDRIVRRGLREAVPLWPPEADDPTYWSHRPAEWYNARLELADLIQGALSR
jgi:Glycoside hydrolase 123 N-terminal domain